MKTKIEAMKDKIADKKAKAKDKIAAKVKARGGKCAALATLFAFACVLGGCMDTNPASRANSNRFGDVEPGVKIIIGENACSNTVSVTMPTTFGDGVLASADSAGSTETHTATPTQTTDVKPDIDVEVPVTKTGAAATAADAAASLLKGAASGGAASGETSSGK